MVALYFSICIRLLRNTSFFNVLPSCESLFIPTQLVRGSRPSGCCVANAQLYVHVHKQHVHLWGEMGLLCAHTKSITCARDNLTCALNSYTCACEQFSNSFSSCPLRDSIQREGCKNKVDWLNTFCVDEQHIKPHPTELEELHNHMMHNGYLFL